MDTIKWAWRVNGTNRGKKIKQTHCENIKNQLAYNRDQTHICFASAKTKHFLTNEYTLFGCCSAIQASVYSNFVGSFIAISFRLILPIYSFYPIAIGEWRTENAKSLLLNLNLNLIFSNPFGFFFCTQCVLPFWTWIVCVAKCHEHGVIFCLVEQKSKECRMRECLGSFNVDSIPFHFVYNAVFGIRNSVCSS